MKFRPRFSVGTLVIIVTLVCAYFALWEATKRHAQRQPSFLFLSFDGTHEICSCDDPNFSAIYESNIDKGSYFKYPPMSPAPFVLARKECVEPPLTDEYWPSFDQEKVSYYFWLFGPTIKLPFESEWP